MNKISSYMNILKNILIMAVILFTSFIINLMLKHVFDVQEHITTIFVFAVFLISLLTDGYIYGIAAAFIAVIATNYAFAFPFFSFNFTIPKIASGAAPRNCVFTSAFPAAMLAR